MKIKREVLGKEYEFVLTQDELREAFPGAEFYPKSYCSGVIEITRVCMSSYQ